MKLARKSTQSLMTAYSDILKELRRRKVVRTSNSPTGDYAELLACKKFHLKSAPPSTKSYDAKDKRGNKYQIKSRRLTVENKTQLLGVIRGLGKADFKFLIVVIFNEDYSVRYYYKMPKKVIKQYAKFSKHQNGHILNMRGQVKNDPRASIYKVNNKL
ncbi:MAG TPA: hypothetical protein DDW92_02115 [Candidatus Veblenbacteria bacterium]|nr:MAG: hypothetical protein UR77_C0015G0006 [Candidatus Nomurabacteria bacterium GW2011_GWC2_35_35]KKT16000.1 MAG: hypothetical protein UV96_C0007G0016 [Parcubacteria group bacterium GW2011_GWF2_43_38]KKT17399.1 MAG: hypothetical protein UW01_C0018G0006 [Candidatus Nomurabacteria bacterium GW2011_GWA2_43_66]HAO81684.1 hypothetical protein [Candidatus Veblenbacteria bacterium]HBH17033.1 hypothetical protein [Candidatus Veblenbacteria bacterium]